LFYAAPTIVAQLGAISLSASPISKLRATDDERRQAKRNSLADKLAVEAKALADLKIEKAAVEGEDRTPRGRPRPGPLPSDAHRRRRPGRAALVHPHRRTAARSGGRAALTGRVIGPALTFTNPALPSARSYPGGEDGNFD
jgi:hypothetical protein